MSITAAQRTGGLRQLLGKHTIVEPQRKYGRQIPGSKHHAYAHAVGPDGVTRRFVVDRLDDGTLKTDTIRFRSGDPIVDRALLPEIDRKAQSTTESRQQREHFERARELDSLRFRADGLTDDQRRSEGLPTPEEFAEQLRELELAAGALETERFISGEAGKMRRATLRLSPEEFSVAVAALREELDAGGWIAGGRILDDAPTELRARAYDLDDHGKKYHLWSTAA